WMHTQPWRMIEICGLKYVWHDGDIPELFDLCADPFEMVNLAGDAKRQADVARLHAALVETMRALEDPLGDRAAAS
ncbi:MAG: hypothetical protein AAFY06_08105, partial [Pseudomonadota bacterium]